MNVKFIPRKFEQVSAYLKALPRGTIKVAMAAIGEWFIGTDRRGLRHTPGYKYVSRARAGYRPMSDKMRRWFWANGGPDMIGNNRTGATSNGWFKKVTGGGYGITIGNKAPGAYYTMSDEGQARQPAAVGWRKISVVVQSNMAGAIRHANAAVRAFLAKKG